MGSTHAARRLVAGLVRPGSVAREETPAPGEALSPMATMTVELLEGDQAWLAVIRVSRSARRCSTRRTRP